MTDEQRIAAFLAAKGATVVAQGTREASPADKARRAEARAKRDAQQREHEAERFMEEAREAGGYYGSRKDLNDLLGGW